MGTRSRWLIGMAMMALTCGTAPALAQTCVGDCDGNGRATIDELVRGVNILLERAALELCRSLDASGDGTVAVNELVRAVAALLNGCGVTPAATSSPTDAPTPTPTSMVTTPAPTNTPTGPAPATATPVQTVAVPNVAGEWREDEYHLASSTCDDSINALVESGLSGLPPCVYTIARTGDTLMVTDCGGAEIAGQIDANGMVRVDLPFGELPLEGCIIGIDAELTGNLSVSPTTLEQSAQVSFSGECTLPSCVTVITTRWTRL